MTHGIPEATALLILAIPAAAKFMVAESDTPLPSWLGDGTQISAFALVAWIVYFVLSKWIPQMLEKHAEEMRVQREIHAKNLEKISTDFAENLHLQRADFSENLTRQRGDLLALSKAALRLEKKDDTHHED